MTTVPPGCHHGSDDVSYEFLQAMNAAATVISSGDNESHAHPRPKIVGARGLTGFATTANDELVTPLVYSTEISRSVRLGMPAKITLLDPQDAGGGGGGVAETRMAKVQADYTVLRSSGENLRDDELLRRDDRNRHAVQIDAPHGARELLLGAGAPEHEVERKGRRGVDERQHARLAHEARGVSYAQAKARLLHGGDEPVGILRVEERRDVDVAGQPRPSPDDDRLGAEDVPPVPEPLQHGRERPQQLTGGRHGAAARPPGGASRDPPRAPRPTAIPA